MLSEALAKALRKAGKPVPPPPASSPQPEPSPLLPAPAAVEAPETVPAPAPVPALEVAQVVVAEPAPPPPLAPPPATRPPPSAEVMAIVEAGVGAHAAEALWGALRGVYRLHAVYAEPLLAEAARLRDIDTCLAAGGLAADGRRRSRVIADAEREERKVSDDLRACGPAAVEEAMASLRAEGAEEELAILFKWADAHVIGAGLRPGGWGNGSFNSPHPTSAIGRTSCLEEAVLLHLSAEMAEERKATAILMAEKVRRQEEYEAARDAGNHPTPRRSFLD